MTKNSLAKEKDILWALRGKPFFSEHLIIKARKRYINGVYRYTVIVSKKVLKLAVDRNKFKRRVRSIITTHKNLIKDNIDFVIIAKKGVKNIEFDIIKEEMVKGLKRLEII